MSQRKLAYRDTFTNYLVNTLSADTEGDSIDNELELGSGETIYLVLEVDKTSWGKLFSAVMTGADLAWTEQAHEVTWILWKAAKMGTFCDQVTNCILTNEGTIAAIQALLSNGGQNGGVGDPDNPLSDVILGANWLADVACDDDILWGACQSVIDGVFDATLELLQRLALITNDTELLADLLDAIPIIGGLLSFAVEASTWMIEKALPLYLAADSPAVRDELACELFCLGKEQCSISFETVQKVFADNAASTPPFNSNLIDNLEWLFDLVLVGDPDKSIASSISLLGLFIMRNGGKFGEMALGVRSLQQLAALGAAEYPSDGWEVTCDPCPEPWCADYGVGTGLDTWIAFAGRAVYDNGWGIGNDEELIQINSPVFGMTLDITSIEITMSEEFVANFGFQYWPNGVIGSPGQENSGGDGISHLFETESTTTRVAVGIDGVGDLTTKIVNIRMRGMGEPPKTPNC
jgi:hypothetical protein